MKDHVSDLKYLLDNHPDNKTSTISPFIPRICHDLGVSKQTLYQWVNGKQKPRKRHQHTIIKVLPAYMKELEALRKERDEAEKSMEAEKLKYNLPKQEL